MQNKYKTNVKQNKRKTKQNKRKKKKILVFAFLNYKVLYVSCLCI